MDEQNIIHRIQKYLPPFIVINTLMEDILTSLGRSMYYAADAGALLVDANWVKSGINKELIDWKIFNCGMEDLAIQRQALEERFIIHLNRGTINGILPDIKRISGDPDAAINILGQEASGLWIESTFPGINARTFAEAESVIEIHFTNNSIYSKKEIEQIIIRELVPINFTTVFL